MISSLKQAAERNGTDGITSIFMNSHELGEANAGVGLQKRGDAVKAEVLAGLSAACSGKQPEIINWLLATLSDALKGKEIEAFKVLQQRGYAEQAKTLQEQYHNSDPNNVRN